MKKYFAKYLPVEGEIEEGEVCHSKWRSKNKFYHYYTCKMIKDGRIYPTEGVGSIEGFPIEDGTKVKLFLCSRDIQVGDLVFASNKEYAGNVIDELDLRIWKEEEKAYKVIGEISPEATWVKDGDEFDAKELQYPSICVRATAANDGNEKYHYPFTESDDQPYPSNPQKIQVRCPNCNHFH